MSVELGNYPALRVRRGRMPDEQGDAGMLDFEPASWSASADKIGMDEVQCLIFLSTRVGEAKRATNRHRNIFGRIYNSLTGTQAIYAIVPGNVLMRALKLVQGCPNWLEPQGEYELRVDIAQNLLSQFSDILRDKQAIP